MSSSSTLTINVIDAQDTPPSFIGTPYFGYVYEVSVPVSIKTSSCFDCKHEHLQNKLFIAQVFKYFATLL